MRSPIADSYKNLSSPYLQQLVKIKKWAAMILIIAIGAIAIGAPTWFAINESIKQSFDAETDRVHSYARDVLHRSDATADQVARGIEKLQRTPGNPCSNENVAIMRQLDLVSSYIQAFGYVSDNHLICSSLGMDNEKLDLGPGDLTTTRGTVIRNKVKLPFTGNNAFIVLEKNGYAAIIHKDLPIDTTTNERDIALAVFSLEHRAPLTAIGPVNPEWMAMLKGQDQVTFSDGKHVVAVVKSKRYLTAAVAAMPVAYLEARTQEVARRLVPIGVIAGVLLTVAIFYLTRMQMALPTAIKTGLKRNEFFLLYQPIVDLQTGSWVGVEALIRWRRPVGEIIGPDVFIPIAEESGLIERITERVLSLAAKDVGDVFHKHPDFHLAINLSSRDLHSKVTTKLLSRFLHATGAKPSNLIVEATERGFLNVTIAREVTSEIRSLGIGIAVDDFGTGYSSLSYLQSFDLDFLKIDKSFVDAVGTEAPTSHVVAHIIEMAKDLKLEMIAEGVETEVQAQYLRDHGVQYAQGWLFGRPIPFPDIARQLSRASTSLSL